MSYSSTMTCAMQCPCMGVYFLLSIFYNNTTRGEANNKPELYCIDDKHRKTTLTPKKKIRNTYCLFQTTNKTRNKVDRFADDNSVRNTKKGPASVSTLQRSLSLATGSLKKWHVHSLTFIIAFTYQCPVAHEQDTCKQCKPRADATSWVRNKG